MIRGFASAALAMLALGGGRVEAAPSNTLQVNGDEPRDVVRESLSLALPQPPAVGGIAPAAPTPSDRPSITDPSAQTPTATFTFRPAVAVRGDAGLVGSAVVNSRRNPGNVSNLRGTIGSGTAGIYSVPRVGIAIDTMPAEAYNYLFRPVLSIDAALPSIATTEAVLPEWFQDSPSRSVFIGVRSPVGDAEREQKAREASIISATGSASPTVMVTPLPGGGGQGTGLAYQLDAGPATTIGFSTQDLLPTRLEIGAAASTTLGYTYVPIGQNAQDDRLPVASGPATLPSVADTTVGMSIPVAPDSAVAPVGAFAVGRPDGVETLSIPIQPVTDLDAQGAGGRGLVTLDTVGPDDSSDFLRDVLLAGAVTVPLALAFLAFRLVRRKVLSRLEA